MSKELYLLVLFPGGSEYSKVTDTPLEELYKPGTSFNIPGSFVGTLDGIISFLGMGLASRYLGHYGLNFRYSPDLGVWIKEKAERRNFFGDITPETLIIVPTSPGFIGDKRVYERHTDTQHPYNRLTLDQTMSFVTMSRMDSTGRPNYGQIITRSTLYLTRIFQMKNDGECQVMARITSAQTKRRGIVGIENLLKESRDNWEEFVRIAMRNPYIGGIPSLGRYSR